MITQREHWPAKRIGSSCGSTCIESGSCVGAHIFSARTVEQSGELPPGAAQVGRRSPGDGPTHARGPPCPTATRSQLTRQESRVMRITDVKVLLHDRVSPRLAVFGVQDGRLPMGVLRISTDAGIEGHNFLSYPGPGPLGIAQQIVTFIKPLLLGADPLDIGVHWRRMAGLSHFISPIAMGTVDVALWDIAGKAAGMPIHRLLGTCRDRIPVYFSSGHHQTPEGYAEEAVYWREQGWKGYKLHPPRAPWLTAPPKPIAL